MSKFCMQCGAQIDDNAEICSSCGAPQTVQSPQTSETAAVAEKNSKKSKVPAIAITAVVIVILLLILKALFGGSYKEPIKNMCKALETGKGKYIYKCMPKSLMDEEFEDMKKSEIIDEFDEMAEGVQELLENQYGDDLKISFKIKDKEKIDKDDIEDLEDDLDIKISKGYEVKVKLNIKGDDDKDTTTTNIEVYKVKGDWCVLDTSSLL